MSVGLYTVLFVLVLFLDISGLSSTVAGRHSGGLAHTLQAHASPDEGSGERLAPVSAPPPAFLALSHTRVTPPTADLGASIECPLRVASTEAGRRVENRFGHVTATGEYRQQLVLDRLQMQGPLPRVITLSVYDAIADDPKPPSTQTIQCATADKSRDSTALLQKKQLLRQETNHSALNALSLTSTSTSTTAAAASAAQHSLSARVSLGTSTTATAAATIRSPMQSIGAYTQGRVLGEGAFGVVYEYVNREDSSKTVVVKFLKFPDGEAYATVHKAKQEAFSECGFAQRLQRQFRGCYLFMNCYHTGYRFTDDPATNDLHMILESGGPTSLGAAITVQTVWVWVWMWV